jgi:hypothetical protein
MKRLLAALLLAAVALTSAAPSSAATYRYAWQDVKWATDSLYFYIPAGTAITDLKYSNLIPILRFRTPSRSSSSPPPSLLPERPPTRSRSITSGRLMEPHGFQLRPPGLTGTWILRFMSVRGWRGVSGTSLLARYSLFTPLLGLAIGRLVFPTLTDSPTRCGALVVLGSSSIRPRRPGR